jgi:hypothetical protein
MREWGLMRDIHDGDSWGDWSLDASRPHPSLVLQSGRHHYEINLHSIGGSAEMLDWIF